MKDPRFALLRASDAHDAHDAPTTADVERVRSAARAVAEGAAEFAHIDAARDAIRRQRTNCWELFHDEFIGIVRVLPARQAAWAAVFENRFNSAVEELPSKTMLSSEQPLLDVAAIAWKAESDPAVVWTQLPEVHLHLNDITDATEMLLRIHPARGLLALDTLPFPATVRRLLARHSVMDRDLIEEMLHAAPFAFNERGAWVQNRSVTALHVTDLITQHAEALSHAYLDAVWFSQIRRGQNAEKKSAAQQALKEVRGMELPNWLVHAFRLLLKRADGVPIAIKYLAHLSQRMLRGNGVTHQPGDTWSVFSAAANALAMLLSQSQGVIAQIRTAWENAEQRAAEKKEDDARRRRVKRRSAQRKGTENEEGRCTLSGDGLPWLAGAGSVLAWNSNSMQDLDTFWSWFEELLDRRDPGLSLITHGTSLADVPQQFGNLLSRLPSPHSRWRATYSILEAQRRRANFGHRYVDETDRDLGSVILIRVGLNAAAHLVHRANSIDDVTLARDWFFQIYGAARRLWLTAVLDLHNVKRDLVTLCFAFMPHIFGDALAEALAQTVPPIANEPRMLSEASAYLQNNGIEPETLRTLIADAGADIEMALRDARQWLELSDDKQTFPERLQSLARELHIDFDNPATTP